MLAPIPREEYIVLNNRQILTFCLLHLSQMSYRPCPCPPPHMNIVSTPLQDIITPNIEHGLLATPTLATPAPENFMAYLIISPGSPWTTQF